MTFDKSKVKTLDLVVLSHLRWNFVWQRPQHLLSRFARDGRVFFVEEPIGTDESEPRLETYTHESGVQVIVPQLPHQSWGEYKNVVPALFKQTLEQFAVSDYFLWYYNPMMIGWAEGLKPRAVVYDCMDELSAFKNAPPELVERERELFQQADLVFTGGQSLYEAKKTQHPRVYAFPSSIEVEHFARARQQEQDPPDQAAIARPRLGFYGVIDERFDIELLREIAALRPEWQFVMIGPVVKINPETLPQAINVHYLGGKQYAELPAYLGGWDAALLPFALNESTRFISPTKTPEYLAAGRPVVSTPIRDVVRPYGEMKLARIAATPAEFVAACEAALAESPEERLPAVDKFLAGNSWDKTYEAMRDLINEVLTLKNKNQAIGENVTYTARTIGERDGESVTQR